MGRAGSAVSEVFKPDYFNSNGVEEGVFNLSIHIYPLAYPFGKVDRDSYFDDGNGMTISLLTPILLSPLRSCRVCARASGT